MALSTLALATIITPVVPAIVAAIVTAIITAVIAAVVAAVVPAIVAAVVTATTPTSKDSAEAETMDGEDFFTPSFSVFFCLIVRLSVLPLVQVMTIDNRRNLDKLSS